jgi:opacity protein-like surface antigen
MRIRLAMGFVGVLGLSSFAAADENTGFYVGGGVGQYTAQIDHPVSDLGINRITAPAQCAVAGQTTDACARNFSDSGAVWDVMAGFKFLSWLAVQADYNWFEDAQSRIPIHQSRNFVVNGDAYELSIKPSLPLFGGFFEPYVRLGWNWYNVDGKYQYVKGSSNSDNAGMAAGGVALNFTPHFAINAEYEYVDVNSGALDSATIRFIYKMPR